MTTELFLADLRAEFGEGNPWLEAAIQAWIFGPGLPDGAPQIISPALDEVEQWLRVWLGGGPLPVGVDWSSHEWVHFVRALPEDLSVERLRELDTAYGLSETGNAELLTAWLTLTLGQAGTLVVAAVLVFLQLAALPGNPRGVRASDGALRTGETGLPPGRDYCR